MKIISNKKKLLNLIRFENNLGLVPTMGAIHKAHISLIKKSISMCKKTIVTIYVNKPQFNRNIDFIKYPRNLKKDIQYLKNQKIDYLYLPTNKQIYSTPPNKKIKVDPLSKKLDGKFRPGHFEAVVDVVDRLIKIINPSKIFFGQKDMQQLKIVESFINKNHKSIKIIGCKTIREKNGIPYSSRNSLLSRSERLIAFKIYKFLLKNKSKLIKNKSSLKYYKSRIKKFGITKIDYLEIVDVNKMIKPYKKIKKIKIFLAYFLGSTRLIDNF